MPGHRCMMDAAVLPNGKLVIVGGTEEGERRLTGLTYSNALSVDLMLRLALRTQLSVVLLALVMVGRGAMVTAQFLPDYALCYGCQGSDRPTWHHAHAPEHLGNVP